MIENHLIDILVSTGANISEDIIEAMGYKYFQVTPNGSDDKLFREGYNRYYDICGKESDYLEMTELIAEFILTLNEEYNYSSREFLHKFGLWLHSRGIDSIVTSAALNNVPIFCPAAPAITQPWRAVRLCV